MPYIVNIQSVKSWYFLWVPLKTFWIIDLNDFSFIYVLKRLKEIFNQASNIIIVYADDVWQLITDFRHFEKTSLTVFVCFFSGTETFTSIYVWAGVLFFVKFPLVTETRSPVSERQRCREIKKQGDGHLLQSSERSDASHWSRFL